MGRDRTARRAWTGQAVRGHPGLRRTRRSSSCPLILRRFPEASVTVAHGDDADGIDLVPIVDVDDLNEVRAVVLDPVLDLKFEEKLPMYAITDSALERVLARFRDERAITAMTAG